MSEIRLADDDKDRKYRIRINEDGEEELEIVEQPEPEEEPDLMGFQADEDDYDGDETDTTELMIAAREEQKRLAREEAQENIAKAKERIAEGDVKFALVALDAAQNAWDEEWEIYTLKLELLTNYFTDFSRIDECISLKEGYEKFVPEEQKAVLRDKYAGVVKAKADELFKQAESENAENESKKAERRVRFKANRNRSLRNFLCALIPFIIVLCVAIGLSTIMFSQGGGVLFVLPIVFFALAAVGLIAVIIMLRPLVRDANRLRLNERNTSTAIGRAYLESSQKAEEFAELYGMLTYVAPVKESTEYAAVIDGEVSEI